jgi:hypothetical protein
MSRRAPYEVPTELREAKQRFEEWRSSHSGRWPIPEALWTLAAELAARHGVFRTAQALRLDYTKLKRHSGTSTPLPKPVSAPQAAFVELITSPAAQTCECVIEVEGPRGRMRIEWKGPGTPDLAGLSRMLWEPGA